jgi:fucose permease
MLSHKNTKSLQMSLYILISILVGIYLSLRGATLPNVAKQVGVGLGEIGIIITSGSAGLLLVNFLANSIFDRLKGHRILAVSAVFMAIGTALIPVIDNIFGLIVLTFLIGAFGGLLLMGINTLPLWVFGNRSGTAMNAIQFFSGIGQFMGPLLVSATLPINGTIHWAFWVCAAGFAVVLPIALLVNSPQIRQQIQPLSQEETRTVEKSSKKNKKIIILLSLFMLIYLGGEVSFGSWVTTFAQSQLPPDRINQSYQLASTFWIFMVIGRLLAMLISTRVSSRTLLSIDMTGILVSLGIVIFSDGNWSTLVLGTILLGLSMASVFASVFNYAEELLSVTGKISSLLMMGASAGAIIFPMILGNMIAVYQPNSIMIALLVMMLISTGILFLLNVTVGQNHNHDLH